MPGGQRRHRLTHLGQAASERLSDVDSRQGPAGVGMSSPPLAVQIRQVVPTLVCGSGSGIQPYEGGIEPMNMQDIEDFVRKLQTKREIDSKHITTEVRVF
jgi:hypothetical protein